MTEEEELQAEFIKQMIRADRLKRDYSKKIFEEV